MRKACCDIPEADADPAEGPVQLKWCVYAGAAHPPGENAPSRSPSAAMRRDIRPHPQHPEARSLAFLV